MSVLRALVVLLSQTALLFSFVHHPTSAYRYVTIHGHPVYLSPEAVADPELTSRAIKKLEANLVALDSTLPKPALEKLTKIAFWMEHDNPEVPGMTYHPSAAWLHEHGYNIEKARGIEIGNLQNFLDWQRIQPFMTFHELSHAYHHQVLGFEEPRIHKAYDLAVVSHRYESVAYAGGGRRRAYALTDHKEYFAELSEAFFGRNDFYPFNGQQLKEFDPEGYKVVQESWSPR